MSSSSKCPTSARVNVVLLWLYPSEIKSNFESKLHMVMFADAKECIDSTERGTELTQVLTAEMDKKQSL